MTMRMVSAELLKLRRRRGLFWWSLVLSVGVVSVVFAILEILHLNNPDHYGPPGGLNGLQGSIIGLSLAGSVAAILVGTAAGTADVSSGVFRDLVATGRSRWALFAARVPGALLFFLPIITLGYIVIAACSVGLAGSPSHPTGAVEAAGLAAPSVGLIARGYVWVVVVTGFDLVLALGLASLIGSRATTIGVLLGWQFLAAPLIAQISLLGSSRQALYPLAFDRLIPRALFTDQGSPVIIHSVEVAVVVLLAWTAAALGAGAWRTATRDA
jgi:ABC-type transport system involved in multi-copper enzyme maturation permease subunit